MNYRPIQLTEEEAKLLIEAVELWPVLLKGDWAPDQEFNRHRAVERDLDALRTKMLEHYGHRLTGRGKGWIDPSQPRYGWAWNDGGSDCDPPEPDKWWITIGPLDEDESIDDEVATIVCRDRERVKREHPEWIGVMERNAQRIVDALNAKPSPAAVGHGWAMVQVNDGERVATPHETEEAACRDIIETCLAHPEWIGLDPDDDDVRRLARLAERTAPDEFVGRELRPRFDAPRFDMWVCRMAPGRPVPLS